MVHRLDEGNERRSDVLREVDRTRTRLHELEGKMVTVEMLVKHLIERLDAKDRNFKWLVGVAIAAGPSIGILIQALHG